MMSQRAVGGADHVSDLSGAPKCCQIALASKIRFCLLAVLLSGCSLFSRGETFLAYNLPLTVLVRTDPTVEQALLEYRDACGQPALVHVEGPLQEALKKKLGMVFHKVIVSPSSAVPVDGIVDVALGLKQLDLFVPRKGNRSYPATVTLGLDFSYSDTDGTVRGSKKIQSQGRDDVEATKESCAIKGVDDLAKQTADKVVEGMAKYLGESAKIREAAQSPKAPVAVADVPDRPRVLEPSGDPAPRADNRVMSDTTAPIVPRASIPVTEQREAEETRLSFRTIFRDENRNQVLEQQERFTLDFQIKNEGPAPANDVEIDMAGHPAVIRNLPSPVKVGTVGPGEVKRVVVDGVLGSVKEVEQAELVCALRAAGPVDLPPAKKFLVAIRPDTEDDAEILSVDVDQMPRAPVGFKQPHAIGIAIGAGQFRDPAMPDIRFAGRDAEVMAKYFQSFMGIPSQRVKLIRDAHVMKEDLAEVFEQWLPRQADPQGTVLVYVSGRGLVDAGTGAVSLVPFDGTASSQARLFSLARIQRALSRASIRQAVLLLDLSLESSPGTDPSDDLAPMWDGAGHGKEADRLMWIVGNNALQDAHAYRPGQHGLFTYYLFKGLRGAADLDQNGIVLAGELCSYVHRQVQEVAKHQYGNAQEPLCLPDDGRPSRLHSVPLTKLH
jgi:uncharacterized caspase-like protein